MKKREETSSIALASKKEGILEGGRRAKGESKRRKKGISMELRSSNIGELISITARGSPPWGGVQRSVFRGGGTLGGWRIFPFRHVGREDADHGGAEGKPHPGKVGSPCRGHFGLGSV